MLIACKQKFSKFKILFILEVIRLVSGENSHQHFYLISVAYETKHVDYLYILCF